MSTIYLTLNEIYDLAKKTLISNNCDEETANILADLIMKAERDGSLSHGLFRLPAYVAGLKSGKINGKARPEVKKISQSVIKVLGNCCWAFFSKVCGTCVPPQRNQRNDASLGSSLCQSDSTKSLRNGVAAAVNTHLFSAIISRACSGFHIS